MKEYIMEFCFGAHQISHLFKYETIKKFLKEGWIKVETSSSLKFLVYKALEKVYENCGKKISSWELMGLKC